MKSYFCLKLRSYFLKHLIVLTLIILSIAIIPFCALAQDTVYKETLVDFFDPAYNTFLVNDLRFYTPLIALKGNERTKAEKWVNNLFDRKGGLCLGITRTTAMAFEQNTKREWLLEYDKEFPDQCFAYERAFAIGYYNVSSFGLKTNGIPGNTMWSKFVVDPSGSLFRTIVNQHGSPQLFERAYTMMIKSFPNSKKQNYSEVQRVVKKIQTGHPWPVGLYSADLLNVHAVLAYGVAGENHPRDNENAIVLVVWDPNNIRDYYSSDEAGYSPDVYDYIEISSTGDITASLADTPRDFYKYIIFDQQFDPNCADLSDIINESLMKQAEAMGK